MFILTENWNVRLFLDKTLTYISEFFLLLYSYIQECECQIILITLVFPFIMLVNHTLKRNVNHAFFIIKINLHSWICQWYLTTFHRAPVLGWWLSNKSCKLFTSVASSILTECLLYDLKLNLVNIYEISFRSQIDNIYHILQCIKYIWRTPAHCYSSKLHSD